MFQRLNSRRVFAKLDACCGECLLRAESARQHLTGAIYHFQNERWWVGDFVIMPNHVHLLVVPMDGCELEDVLYSVKRFSARKINQALGRKGCVWQKEYYDHIVRDRAELIRIREYIAKNPSKSCLKIGEYKLHSAKWLDESAAPDSDPVA